MASKFEKDAAEFLADIRSDYLDWADEFDPIENQRLPGTFVFGAEDESFLSTQDPRCIWYIDALPLGLGESMIIIPGAFEGFPDNFRFCGYLVSRKPWEGSEGQWWDANPNSVSVGWNFVCDVCEGDETEGCENCQGQGSTGLSVVGDWQG